MPIYAYKCSACDHAKDVLQKVSDAPLTMCPACGAETFSRQITAAGFQLKGSGWYATDFRNGSKPADAAKAGTDGKESATTSATSEQTGARDGKTVAATSDGKTGAATGDGKTAAAAGGKSSADKTQARPPAPSPAPGGTTQ